MSVKSKKSKLTARPFKKADLARARQIAECYQIIVNLEDGLWYGHGLEMPHVFADGDTVEACVEDMREALVAAVATMIEAGQTPPRPANCGARTEQVNVRISSEEKILLESRARQKGFRGVSDFLRATALAD